MLAQPILSAVSTFKNDKNVPVGGGVINFDFLRYKKGYNGYASKDPISRVIFQAEDDNLKKKLDSAWNQEGKTQLQVRSNNYNNSGGTSVPRPQTAIGGGEFTTDYHNTFRKAQDYKNYVYLAGAAFAVWFIFL
jgi:hypothetical protein